MKAHWAIHVRNSANKSAFLKAFTSGKLPDSLAYLRHKKGAVFSKASLDRLMDKEERHGHKPIEHTSQPLKSMSSGERKRALLQHILAQNPDYIVLDNPFDNLDAEFVAHLKNMLRQKSESIIFIQLASRAADILPFVDRFGQLIGEELATLPGTWEDITEEGPPPFLAKIPRPAHQGKHPKGTLVSFKKVSVSYGEKSVLKDIDWEITTGDFWQLSGPNGSGKTTLLSMITGDNPKAFGQDLYLFGRKKGSGETVWDIKRHMGYYSPAMTDTFGGRHSVEHMLISGLMDSIGLYVLPTQAQKRYIEQWLLLLGLLDRKETLFRELSTGYQRLVMTARAMVKHPPLLILDEPTAGMDDASSRLLVHLVNKMAQETETAILFVSHRMEPGLRPTQVYELHMGTQGSTGRAITP